ncbi:hypothetical protein [Gimesia sp.]|uniref:hypothetical protein n=1 Tax=Gimesia sp. TaxID=2024833 RepID=UPI003A912B8E
MNHQKEELTGADAEYGYRFGCEGLMSLKHTAEFLDVCENTVRQLCKDGYLRKGKRPYKGAKSDQHKRVVICRCSLRKHIELTQE